MTRNAHDTLILPQNQKHRIIYYHHTTCPVLTCFCCCLTATENRTLEHGLKYRVTELYSFFSLPLRKKKSHPAWWELGIHSQGCDWVEQTVSCTFWRTKTTISLIDLAMDSMISFFLAFLFQFNYLKPIFPASKCYYKHVNQLSAWVFYEVFFIL